MRETGLTWVELDESIQAARLVLDDLKQRGMTADVISAGNVTLSGLRYPPPPKRDDGEPVDQAEDDLTFASAG